MVRLLADRLIAGGFNRLVFSADFDDLGAYQKSVEELDADDWFQERLQKGQTLRIPRGRQGLEIENLLSEQRFLLIQWANECQ